eukprot:gene42054-55813_t
MVFYFLSIEGYTIYMGKDKFENEDLIRYGIPEDIWFHVDDLSSAHVYLRLRKDQRLEDVTPETIMECAQLVKANSIEGCKLKEVDVIYTRWRNLHKLPSMEAGAIGFHDKSKIKKLRVTKDNTVVNRINKTKEERHPDLAEEQRLRSVEMRAAAKQEKRLKEDAERTAKIEREQAAKLRSFESLMDEDKMRSNTDLQASVDNSSAKDFEDDFM